MEPLPANWKALWLRLPPAFDGGETTPGQASVMTVGPGTQPVPSGKLTSKVSSSHQLTFAALLSQTGACAVSARTGEAYASPSRPVAVSFQLWAVSVAPVAGVIRPKVALAPLWLSSWLVSENTADGLPVAISSSEPPAKLLPAPIGASVPPVPTTEACGGFRQYSRTSTRAAASRLPLESSETTNDHCPAASSAAVQPGATV